MHHELDLYTSICTFFLYLSFSFSFSLCLCCCVFVQFLLPFGINLNVVNGRSVPIDHESNSLLFFLSVFHCYKFFLGKNNRFYFNKLLVLLLLCHFCRCCVADVQNRRWQCMNMLRISIDQTEFNVVLLGPGFYLIFFLIVLWKAVPLRVFFFRFAMA